MIGLTLFKANRSAVTSAGDRGVVLLRAPRARAPRATRPARASGGGLAGPLAPLLLIAAEPPGCRGECECVCSTHDDDHSSRRGRRQLFGSAAGAAAGYSWSQRKRSWWRQWMSGCLRQHCGRGRCGGGSALLSTQTAEAEMRRKRQRPRCCRDGVSRERIDGARGATNNGEPTVYPRSSAVQSGAAPALRALSSISGPRFIWLQTAR